MQYGFIEHPREVPATIVPVDPAEGSVPSSLDLGGRQLQGGIVIHTEVELRPGQEVEVRTGLPNRPVRYRARVLWVVEQEARSVGLVFESEQQAFLARMTEQVCHIEHFRLQQARLGRQLSEAEAAREWIEKHSQDFPRIGPITPTEHLRHSAA